MHNGWTIQEWKTMLKKLFIPLSMAYKDFLMIMITLNTFYNHLIEGIYISWLLFCLSKHQVSKMDCIVYLIWLLETIKKVTSFTIYLIL
jgi:hypothetical protein